VAPFVLENLGCSGNEERLVDCPVVADTPVRIFGSPYGPEYEYDFRTERCNPLGLGNFVRIACGTTSSAGVPDSC